MLKSSLFQFSGLPWFTHDQDLREKNDGKWWKVAGVKSNVSFRPVGNFLLRQLLPEEFLFAQHPVGTFLNWGLTHLLLWNSWNMNITIAYNFRSHLLLVPVSWKSWSGSIMNQNHRDWLPGVVILPVHLRTLRWKPAYRAALRRRLWTVVRLHIAQLHIVADTGGLQAFIGAHKALLALGWNEDDNWPGKPSLSL